MKQRYSIGSTLGGGSRSYCVVDKYMENQYPGWGWPKVFNLTREEAEKRAKKLNEKPLNWFQKIFGLRESKK